MQQEIEKKALQFQESLGLRPPHPFEVMIMSETFAHELRGGLEDPPHPGSLKMIQTHLSEVSPDRLRGHEGESALILEIGGTNVFAARGVIIDGKPQIATGSRGIPIQTRGELSKRKFTHPNEFFTEVLRHADPVARGWHITKLGIIYTFAATAQQSKLGVDARSPEELTKNFRIDGISQRPVGDALIDYMYQAGYDISDLESLVVLNDTPATLLSIPGAKIGGIIGTGYNLAMMVEGKIYNLECGEFASVPQYSLSRTVDGWSDNPGSQIAEKQISGMYLGMAMEKAMSELGSWGFFLEKRHEGFLDGKVVSDILNGDVAAVSEYMAGDVNEGMMAMLTPVARMLRLRSATLVATHLATIVDTFLKEFPQFDVIVPIEGSVFWQMPEYQQLVSKLIAGAIEKRFLFPQIDHAGALGATAAVIGLRG